MDHARITALANLLDAMTRDQRADGFQVFTLSSEDKISFIDVETIVTALRWQSDDSEELRRVYDALGIAGNESAVDAIRALRGHGQNKSNR